MLQGQVNTIASQARRACRSAVRVAIRINPFKKLKFQICDLLVPRGTQSPVKPLRLKGPGFPAPKSLPYSTLFYLTLLLSPGASPFGRACYAASDL